MKRLIVCLGFDTPRENKGRQMKHWPAIANTLLVSAAVTLSGCQSSTIAGIDEENLIGLPTRQRASAGDKVPGTSPSPSPGSRPSPGGNPGGPPGGNNGGSPGGTSPGPLQPESGTNPASVTLDAPLLVTSLYPKASAVSVPVSNAPQGMLAIAAPLETPASLKVTWSGAGTFRTMEAYQTLGLAPARSDDEALAISLRQRLVPTGLSGAPGFNVLTMPTRSLKEGSPTKLMIGSSEVEAIEKAADTTGKYRNKAYRQKFKILLDKDDAALLTNEKFFSDLKAEIQNHIYPSNRDLFGDDPTAAEAAAVGMAIDSDVTYFVFSSKVNAGGRSDVLGYFSLADLLPPSYWGNSNQAKILYLSAGHAAKAQTNTQAFNDLCGTIAHELAHMLYSARRIENIGANARRVEFTSYADTWIDEGLAMYAAAAAGYGPEGRAAGEQIGAHVHTFLANAPAFSLTTFYSDRPSDHPIPADRWVGNPAAGYGMSYLFTQYMIDRQGPDLIKKIYTSKAYKKNASETLSADNISPTGPVQDALQRDGTSFAVLFGDFAAALALDGTSALANATSEQRARYSINGINLRSILSTGPKGQTSTTLTPRPFGVTFLKPDGLSSGSTTLGLQGGTNLSTRLILYP